MEHIFKVGNHFLAGISLIYIESLKTYSLLVTFMLLHFTIDILNCGIRLGFSIGNGEVFFKIQAGSKI